MFGLMSNVKVYQEHGGLLRARVPPWDLKPGAAYWRWLGLGVGVW